MATGRRTGTSDRSRRIVDTVPNKSTGGPLNISAMPTEGSMAIRQGRIFSPGIFLSGSLSVASVGVRLGHYDVGREVDIPVICASFITNGEGQVFERAANQSTRARSCPI